jgi:hypothetical protein
MSVNAEYRWEIDVLALVPSILKASTTCSVLYADYLASCHIVSANMIPPVADSSDPDPTSQLPWPSRGRTPALVQSSSSPAHNAVPQNGPPKRASTPQGKRFFTTWDLITLSISMAGAQIAWTVELGSVTFIARLAPTTHFNSEL